MSASEWEERLSATQAELDQVVARMRDTPELDDLNVAVIEAVARLRFKHAEVGFPEVLTWSGIAYSVAQVLGAIRSGQLRPEGLD